jgi:hypothetical protein
MGMPNHRSQELISKNDCPVINAVIPTFASSTDWINSTNSSTSSNFECLANANTPIEEMLAVQNRLTPKTARLIQIIFGVHALENQTTLEERKWLEANKKRPLVNKRIFARLTQAIGRLTETLIKMINSVRKLNLALHTDAVMSKLMVMNILLLAEASCDLNR